MDGGGGFFLRDPLTLILAGKLGTFSLKPYRPCSMGKTAEKRHQGGFSKVIVR